MLPLGNPNVAVSTPRAMPITITFCSESWEVARPMSKVGKDLALRPDLGVRVA